MSLWCVHVFVGSYYEFMVELRFKLYHNDTITRNLYSYIGVQVFHTAILILP